MLPRIQNIVPGSVSQAPFTGVQAGGFIGPILSARKPGSRQETQLGRDDADSQSQLCPTPGPTLFPGDTAAQTFK